MKNLSPHRTFRGPSTIKGSMRPFYQHAWPEDLPPQCPICGTAFRSGWNLQIGANRIGRLLKMAACYSILPCLFGVFMLPSLLPAGFGVWFGEHGGWFFLAMISTPPLLAFLSLLMPIRRHVECKRCGWNQDYPGAKHTPIPPAKASP